MNNPKMPIFRKNISDQIFDIIKTKIANGEYKNGDRLPGENELAEIYGVSRMTARSVYQKLSVTGVIEIKNGEGAFVKKLDFKYYFAQALTLINEKNTFNDISEFRRYFEPICTDIACKKRTDADIENLKKLYDNMLKAADYGEPKDFFDADYKFHLYICEISNNAIIKMIYEILINIIEKHYEETMKKFAILNGYSFNQKDENYVIRKMAHLHKEILDDIINGNNSISKKRWADLNDQYDITPTPKNKFG